jgi:hypothetical protein
MRATLTFLSVVLGFCAAASCTGRGVPAAANAAGAGAAASEGQLPSASMTLSAPPTQSGPDSGIYGFAGGGGGAPPGTSMRLRGECVKVIDQATNQTVAAANCDDGRFRIALPPGRYLVVGPGRQERKMEIAPGEWKAMSFIAHIPGAPR